MESKNVRIGTVMATDPKSHKARVLYQDMGFTSDWLSILRHGVADDWLPQVNDKVLVLYLPIFNGDGFVLGVV